MLEHISTAGRRQEPHIEVDVVHEPDSCSPKQPVPEVRDEQAEAMPVVACKQREAALCISQRNVGLGGQSMKGLHYVSEHSDVNGLLTMKE